jgi:hypothetical protein
MGLFGKAPVVNDPAGQQRITMTRDKIGKAINLLNRSGADVKSGNAKGIITIANQVLNTLEINSGTVESSSVYLDTPQRFRSEIKLSLRAIREVLVSAAKRATNPLLQQPGVTEEKREIIDQINQDFELAKYYLGEIARHLPPVSLAA